MTPKGLIYDEGIVGTKDYQQCFKKKSGLNVFCKMFKTMTRLRKDRIILLLSLKEH